MSNKYVSKELSQTLQTTKMNFKKLLCQQVFKNPQLQSVLIFVMFVHPCPFFHLITLGKVIIITTTTIIIRINSGKLTQLNMQFYCYVVCYTAVFRVVTQCSSPQSGEEHCVTTLKTAVWHTNCYAVPKRNPK